MKSHVRVFLELAVCIYKDAVAMCTELQLEERDLIRLRSRVEHEGLSFLTITLPSLGKDLDRSLSNGCIAPTAFRSFTKFRKAPAFLRGFFGRVFDVDGRIYDKPDVQAIEGIRQIAYFLKKVKVPCSSNRVAAALKKFVKDEQVFRNPLADVDTDNFARVVSLIWPRLLFGNELFAFNSTVPKHGPGATADKLSGNAKFCQRIWHDRLEPFFPLLDTAFVNSNAVDSEEFKRLSIVALDDEQPVRVITVPKTLKTPRIIAIEPTCMQYSQQAVSRALVKGIENYDLTAGHINFSDQQVNRDLAISSSADGMFATIDMSAASDLVPYELALSMFNSNPDLKGSIDACRTRKAQMPDGSIIPLSKFASMGSALCFPVEAMYFYTICVVALLEKYNLSYTSPSIQRVAKLVYVYGDDIIVPTDCSVIVMSYLQKYYCRVNTDKSFFRGQFRESCGMDAFAGKKVTPTYVRETPPDNNRNAGQLVSWTATANLLNSRGFQLSSAYMFKRVERLLGLLPVVTSRCSGLGKSLLQDDGVPKFSSYNKKKVRFNTNEQALEIKAWVVSPVKAVDNLNGYPALLKCLLMLEALEPDRISDRDYLSMVRGFSPRHFDNNRRSAVSITTGYLAKRSRLEKQSADKGLKNVNGPRPETHLEVSERRGVVTLKSRWVRP